MVTVAHARCSEYETAYADKAGDNTGREVVKQEWYNRPWLYLIRPVTEYVASVIATAAEEAADNENVGYNQNNRKTLFVEGEKHKMVVSQIDVPCECDCSSLVSYCVNAAGIAVSKDMWTGNELSILSETKAFNVYSDVGMLDNPSALMVGDILLGQGHTVVVVKTDVENKHKFNNAPKYYNKEYDKYFLTTGNVNIRVDAGKENESNGAIPCGTFIKCNGFYSLVGSRPWMLAECCLDHTVYRGFVSSMYLV